MDDDAVAGKPRIGGTSLKARPRLAVTLQRGAAELPLDETDENNIVVLANEGQNRLVAPTVRSAYIELHSVTQNQQYQQASYLVQFVRINLCTIPSLYLDVLVHWNAVRSEYRFGRDVFEGIYFHQELTRQ